MLGEALQQAGPDALDLYTSIETTKCLAIVSSTILFYDILLTLPEEIYYVWSSRWSFARFAFHANRTWGPILLVCLDSENMGNLREEEMDTYDFIFSAVSLGCLLATVPVPTLILLQRRTEKSKFVPNPAPEVISGCTQRTSLLGTSAYLGPLIYETGIFIMTVYKTWKITRTPLLQRLMRDGSKYYLMVLCTLLLIAIGSFDSRTRRAVLSSGLLTAVTSSMCSRLLLSGLSFYNEEGAAEVHVELGTSGRRSMESDIPGSKWID
ncbi:hypothetical protein BDV93DRAFT_561404 [Ceratobasidium sp. AG-I]|nr:hypothetical protein BDV93DRAFT_561404 [Ceratobasidium sp. AG-I]